ncbi:MAG TPA: hypothetical protein VLX91_09595 [Candidatus Acidoferrales bacterium]|nr:hypothetical protein [Candidatus Acidoferrales bacterium]
MASHSALGFFADGIDLKVAQVVRHGSRMVLMDLHDAKLAQKLEVAAAVSGAGFDSSTETIDVTQQSFQEAPQTEANSAIVTEIFSRYRKRKSVVALSIAEPYVFYHPVEIPGKQKPEKIIAKIIEELQATRSGITSDRIQLLPTTAEGNYIGVIREQDIPILDLVMSAKPFLGNRMPKIAFVESSDVALVNLVRNNYPLRVDEVTVIVHVGMENTRLIFMRGRGLFNVAPIIGEGADSFSVQNTIYSRILLGQDNLSLPRIDRVILCGECKNFDIKGFLSSLLVGAEVDYLQLYRVDSSQLPAGGSDLVPQYAASIASAVRAATGKTRTYYVADLTPRRILEGQKIFKLAWHGLVLSIFVFGSTFYFTYNFALNQNEISKIKSDVVVKRAQAAEVDALRSQIADVQSQFSKYSSAGDILDQLLPNTERWSNLIGSLSKSVQDVGSIWLTDLHKINDNTYSIEGFAVYRDRIPQFAMLYPGSILKKVTVADIRGKMVYDFQIDLKFVEK